MKGTSDAISKRTIRPMKRSAAIVAMAVVALGVACSAHPTAPRFVVPPHDPNQYQFSVDIEQRACEVDSDCRLLASCSCGDCAAMKNICVEECAERCPTDACAGHTVKCDHRLCKMGPHATPTAADVPARLAELTVLGQLLFDDQRMIDALRSHAPFVVAWEPGAPRPTTWTFAGKPIDVVDGRPSSGSYVTPLFIVDRETADLDFWFEGRLLYARLRRRSGRRELIATEVH